ncbi:MAG: DUF167 family protein [Planctomycetota bacterium]|nr:DUF167 family protein [Planctomycetota bacterium]
MNGIDQLNLRDAPGGAILPVKVVPGSSRDKIAGVLGEALKITTSAPPEKGKANLAVAALLAAALGVDKRSVELISSPSNPRKEFRISGLSSAQIRQRLSS